MARSGRQRAKQAAADKTGDGDCRGLARRSGTGAGSPGNADRTPCPAASRPQAGRAKRPARLRPVRDLPERSPPPAKKALKPGNTSSCIAGLGGARMIGAVVAGNFRNWLDTNRRTRQARGLRGLICRVLPQLSGDHTTQKSKTRLGGGAATGRSRGNSSPGRTELPQIQASRQAETLFPLTGEFCAGFTALFRGRVEPSTRTEKLCL
jgi:hypothetical protein